VSSPLILSQPLVKMPLTSNQRSAEQKNNTITTATSFG
jgi:hypothetical protein